LGLHNIPKKGPVIFCGNHNNQFVDGSIAFFTSNRDVQFMVAAKVRKLTNFDQYHLLLEHAKTSDQALF